MNKSFSWNFVVGVMALSLCACQGQSSEQNATPAQIPVAEVTLLEMQGQDVMLTSEMAGRTVSYRWAEVRPEVSGIIRELCFQEGSDVKEGDVLYLIDPDTYQATYDSAKAALSKAEASLNVARLKDQRTTQLYQTKSVSQQDYDDARASYLQAQAEVASAKAALRMAEIDLERTQVRAPISGRIGKSSVTVGALVTANQSAALASIHQTSPMNVDLSQSVDELRSLRQQARTTQEDKELHPDNIQAEVRLKLSDGTRYSETGTLRFADVGVDEGTGTVTLRAEFPNAGHELLPGMFVRAIVNMGTKHDALLLPQQVVLRDNRGTPFVFVAESDGNGGLKAVRRGVTLGSAHGDSWLVLDGLQAGDKVIAGGVHSVSQNAPVREVTESELEARAAVRMGEPVSLSAEAEISAGAGGQA